ncbi:MAG: immunity 51 family protein [Coriobacteriales bacterium]|nr:immunity 51 family protein [Coriobacteriales bacterium]
MPIYLLADTIGAVPVSQAARTIKGATTPSRNVFAISNNMDLSLDGAVVSAKNITLVSKSATQSSRDTLRAAFGGNTTSKTSSAAASATSASGKSLSIDDPLFVRWLNSGTEDTGVYLAGSVEKKVEYDSEADLFNVFSTNVVAMERLTTALQELCDNDQLFEEVLMRIELP